jgi:glycosyltransferase involved in cell wall biosynthesis
VTASLLTAIIPVGPEHLENNRLSNWVLEANRFSDELNLIIVLDSKTLEIAQQYEFKEILNCKVVRGNYGSPGNARNAGLMNVTSNWVCFWDCDDEPIINSFIAMVRAAEYDRCELAVGNFGISDHDNLEESQVYSHEGNLALTAINPGIWRMAFSEKIWKGSSFLDMSMAEDLIFLLDSRLSERRIYFANECVYSYINHKDGQLTKNKFALGQIPHALEMIKERILSGKIPSDKFSIGILARMYVTALNKATILNKVLILGSYLKFLTFQGSIRVALLRATFMIISTKYF